MLDSYSPTMSNDVLHAWAAKAQAELDATRLDAARWRNPPSGFTTWGDLARHLQAEIDRPTTR